MTKIANEDKKLNLHTLKPIQPEKSEKIRAENRGNEFMLTEVSLRNGNKKRFIGINYIL